ncbi:MAG: hypothetical protein GF320_01475 [Armatimonadia bacterium]|nr:hypothetical protein [Armatimonadia bacterium]
MEFHNPWRAPGFWAKAHLHTHTTESDGNLSPAHVAEIHWRCGYSLLAITDHDKVTDVSDLDRDGLALIPGGEVSCPTESGGFYHVVVLGIDAGALPPSGQPIRDTLTAIHQAGGVGFVAHPYWSCNTVDDLVGLPHCVGVEVYNHGCEAEIGKGISSVHWDDALLRGERYVGLAVDDAHMYGYDALGGWTWIRVTDLTADAALEALRQGLVYASMGPEIVDLTVEGSVIEVKTSPAEAIRFMASGQRGWCEQAWGRPPLQGARWRVPDGTTYARVEVLDERGRRAWSPPIYF